MYELGWAGLRFITCGNRRIQIMIILGVSKVNMAGRQQRQRLRALQNNRQLARFTVQGRATGKQLGTGSYGSVEEVCEGL